VPPGCLSSPAVFFFAYAEGCERVFSCRLAAINLRARAESLSSMVWGSEAAAAAAFFTAALGTAAEAEAPPLLLPLPLPPPPTKAEEEEGSAEAAAGEAVAAAEAAGVENPGGASHCVCPVAALW
jgi:hypothetical protein